MKNIVNITGNDGKQLKTYSVNEFKHKHPDWNIGTNYHVAVIGKELETIRFKFISTNKAKVVSSIKGVNPYTLLPAVDSLVDYDKCPVHNCTFVGDRFCIECDMPWPNSNYTVCNKTADLVGFWDKPNHFKEFKVNCNSDLAYESIGSKSSDVLGFSFYTLYDFSNNLKLYADSKQWKDLYTPIVKDVNDYYYPNNITDLKWTNTVSCNGTSFYNSAPNTTIGLGIDVSNNEQKTISSTFETYNKDSDVFFYLVTESEMEEYLSYGLYDIYCKEKGRFK